VSLPRSTLQDTIGENTAVGTSGKEINPLKSLRKEACRSEEYFEPAPTVRLNAADHHRNASPSPPPEEVEDERSLKRQQRSPEGRRIGDAYSPEDTSDIKDSNVNPVTH